MAKILVIEDDLVISKNLKTWLMNDNHTVDVVCDGLLGLDQLLNYPYDLAIIDWNLPGMDGASICRKLRSERNGLALLMLTSKSSLSERVFGLDSGAFDYLVKPCSLEELSARVRALLRRKNVKKDMSVILKNLRINPVSREVIVGDKNVSLSPTEFDLLLILSKSPEVYHKTDDLLSMLAKTNVSGQLIRVHITNLRKKLLESGCIFNVLGRKGEGYGIFADPAVPGNE